MIDMLPDLIRKLEKFRLENRISQEHLSEMLGVSFITVSRWLNGHTKPSKIYTYHIEKLLARGKHQK